MSQPIRSGMVSMDAMKHFLSKLGESYSLQKRLDTQHGGAMSSEESINEVV